MSLTARLCSIAGLIVMGLVGTVSAHAQTNKVDSSAAAPARPVVSGELPGTMGQARKELPHSIQGGFDLPNGWRITPAGKPIAVLNDLVLNMVVSKDGKIVVASHSGC